MRLIHLINSTFPSLKITFDTLIDVGNAKYQNIKTSKHHILKSPMRIFQSVSGPSSEQSKAHGQLYRS